MRTVQIGTRKSQLALAQATRVADLLRAAFPDVQFELRAMSTIGDRVQDRLLSEVGGKGLFAKELEDRLIKGEVDLVVHSLKDLETKQPDGLGLTGVLTRDDPRDVLVSSAGYTVQNLPQNALFGTASVRRTAQLRSKRPDLRTCPLRGNVETRIRKTVEGEADFTLLAKCGLDRLGLTPPGNVVLDIAGHLPAIGQGFIGVQSRQGQSVNDLHLNAMINAICDADALVLANTERAVQDAIDGNCSTAMAAFADYSPAGDVQIRAELYDDTDRCFTASGSSTITQAEILGRNLGEQLLNKLAQS